MWYFYHLLCISFHLVVVKCLASDLGEVVFVNILFRHGDRTPVDPYPNDPYRNNSLWSIGWGQLTDVGKNGHYKLGKWLRARYSHLLPEYYHRDDIYILSTDVDRTLMSAYSNLAGLYEPDLKTNWNPNIKWTPIPVHTIPENLDKVAGLKSCWVGIEWEEESKLRVEHIRPNNLKWQQIFMLCHYEYIIWQQERRITNISKVHKGSQYAGFGNHCFTAMLSAKAPCPKYDRELKILQNSQEFKEIDEENKSLYAYLTKYSGRNVTGIYDVQTIHDTLFIEELYKFRLPSWTKKVYPQPMKKISEFVFSVACYTPTLARLKVGLLIGDMLNHMEEKISGTKKTDRKAWMYSAHDTTVANLLNGLGLFEPHCPPYYSLILIELRKKNGDYFVAIHYKNSTSVPPYFLKLKNCDKLCPFEEFKSIVSPLIPHNWEEECQSVLFAENMYDTAASISLITIVALALIVLLSLAIALRFYKNQRCNEAEFAYKSLNLEISS